MPDNNTVFLFDVDNTLLDNDHVTADLKRHLADARRPGAVPTLLAALRRDPRPSSDTPIIWERCSAIASIIRTIPIC